MNARTASGSPREAPVSSALSVGYCSACIGPRLPRYCALSGARSGQSTAPLAGFSAMPSQRERIRMTDAEVEKFLDAERTVQVASIGPDGTPHLVPMWFAVVAGRVVFWTYAKSQKALHLRP